MFHERGHGVGGSGDPRRNSGAREIFRFVAKPKNVSELITGNSRHSLSPRLWRLTWRRRLKGGLSLWRPSEAEGRHETPALVLNDVRTFQALESGFGVFVAKCRGLFVIGFCCSRVLRAASSALGKCAHSFHCPRMILRGGFFEERSRSGIVFRATAAIAGHQPKLILRLRRVCLRRFREHGPGLDGIGRRATTG